MNRSSLNTVNAGGIRKFFSLALSAAITSLVLLASCGDTVYESKGGSARGGADEVGTINVHVRNGAGTGAFTSAADEVYVTLIAAGQRPQLLTSSGGVSFPNLKPGSYEFRVEKEDYATAYYTADLLLEDDGQKKYSVNLPAVLYKLDADLTGTLLYKKADSTSGYVPSGTKLTLSVDLNRSIDYIQENNLRDVKIETRVFEGQVGADGKYSFGGTLPSIPAGTYNVSVAGFSAGGVEFDPILDLFGANAPALLSGKAVPAPQFITNKVATELRVLSVSLSVSGSEPIEIIFNIAPAKLGVKEDLYKVQYESSPGVATPIPVTVSYGEGNKVSLTPKSGWLESTRGAGTVDVIITKAVKSESGALLAASNAATGSFEATVSIGDALRGDFEVVNVDKNNSIWLKDTTEAIVLVFSKAIDTSRLTTLDLATLPHTVKIEGATVTLTPSTGWWNSAAVVASGFLTLTSLRSVDNDAFLASTTPRISLFNNTTAGFSIVKDASWINNILTLDNDDTKKVLEFTTSEELGSPIVGTQRRVFEVITDLDGDGLPDLKPLESTFSGNKISVKPNTSWKKGAGNRTTLVFEGVVNKQNVPLAATGVVNATDNTPGIVGVSIEFTLLNEEAFHLITSKIELPTDYSKSPLTILFSAPIDTNFLTGNIQVAYNTTTPPAAPNYNNQLFNVTTTNSGKSLVLTPRDNEVWLNKNLTINLTTGPTGLKSTAGEELDGSLGTQVIASRSDASIDISSLRVEKAWIDTGYGDQLFSSSLTNLDIYFTLAKLPSSGKFIGGGEQIGTTEAHYWDEGEYVIQGTSDGKPVSYVIISRATNNGAGGYVNDFNKTNLQTGVVRATVPVDFASTGKLGGKNISFTVTPKLGKSLGLATRTTNEAEGWISIASATALVGASGPKDEVGTDGTIIFDADFTQPSLAGTSTLETTPYTYPTPTNIREGLALALRSLVFLREQTDGSLTQHGKTGDAKIALVAGVPHEATIWTFTFDDVIDPVGVDIDFYWKERNELPIGALEFKLVQQAGAGNERNFDLIVSLTGAKTDIDEYLERWVEYSNSTAYATPATAPEGISLDKTTLTLSNIRGLGTGAPFGFIFEGRRGVPTVATSLVIDLNDIYITK